MIVYTAIYGGYDALKPHVDHPAVERWVCYTDDSNLECPGWEVIVEPARYAHPCVSAKWRKCHPPADVVDAESLWVDGSVQVDNPAFVDTVSDLLTYDHPICMVAHPDRNNIRDEAMASHAIAWAKYGQFDLGAQVDRYEARKGPTKGLWATTVIGRLHTREVLQLGAAWFAHNDLLSYQDQLSLPVLLEDYGIEPVAIPGNLTNNPLFRWRGHIK